MSSPLDVFDLLERVERGDELHVLVDSVTDQEASELRQAVDLVAARVGKEADVVFAIAFGDADPDDQSLIPKARISHSWATVKLGEHWDIDDLLALADAVVPFAWPNRPLLRTYPRTQGVEA